MGKNGVWIKNDTQTKQIIRSGVIIKLCEHAPVINVCKFSCKNSLHRERENEEN